MNDGAPEMLLFDLDGTLVDSVPDLAWCLNAMLAELALPAASEDDVRMWVGNGAERLVKRAITRRMDGEPADRALLQRAMAQLMEIYAANTDRYSQLYPGVIEGLNYARSLGCPLGVVTNKAERFTVPLMRSLGILDHFDIVVGGDTLPTQKPDPGPLLHCAGQYRAAPARSVMIGDSINDLQAARAAGMRILCVSYGYNHGNDIGAYGPDAVLHTLAELPAHL
ncbi:MAG: Phosphoglycolate phosphatase [Gammaproteobacteria bacterium]|nr:Phosphoglycolate phosphatase [Gammaproteobacteria bacterium]